MFLKTDNNKAFVSYIKNTIDPWAPGNMLTVPVECKGEKVSECIKSFVGNVDFYFAAVNGILIDDSDDPVLQQGDYLCFAVGEGNNQTLRIIGAVILTVIAFYAQQHWAYGEIWAAVFVAGAGYLISSGIPIPGQNVNNPANSYEGSANYGFSAAANAWMEGISIPSIVGERWVAPPRISSHRFLPPDTGSGSFRNDEQRQNIRMQFLLTDGVIDDIDEDDIRINGKTLSDYSNVKWECTPGIKSQAVGSSLVPYTLVEQGIDAELPPIEELYSSEPDEEIPLSPSTTSTIQITQNITNILVEVNAPNGLQYASGTLETDQHSYDTYSDDETFTLTLEYRKLPSGSWQSATICYSSIRAQNPYAFVRPMLFGGINATFSISAIGISEGQYEVRLHTGGSHGNHSVEWKRLRGYGSDYSTTGEIYITTGSDNTVVSVNYLLSEGLYYFDTNGDIKKHQIAVMTRIKKYGDADWDNAKSRYMLIEGATTKPFRRTVLFQDLDPGRYVVSPIISGVPPTNIRYKHTVKIEFLQEGLKKSFAYPNCAVLSMDVPAMDSFLDQWPTVQVLIKRADRVKDATPLTSTNPAWAAYDRMIDYYGITDSDVVFSDFEDWADFCDTNSLTVGLYLEEEMNMRDVLDRIGQAGMAKVIPYGKLWRVVIDTQRSARHTFGSDNIIANTFSEKWLSTADRANTILAYYFNNDDLSVRTPVKIVHPNVTDGLLDEIQREIVMWGVTDKDQAIKISRVLLNQTQLARRIMTWESFVDGINCQVGDVTYLQNDGPVFGYAPGRAVNGTSNTVTCDIPLDFNSADDASRDFRLLIRHLYPDTGEKVDYIEVLDMINPYPNTQVVTYTLDGDTFGRTPAKGCLVYIGWVVGTEESTSNEQLSTKKVLINSIERIGERRFKLKAFDYYDDQYIMDYITVDDPPSESGLVVTNPYAGVAWALDGNVRKNVIQLLWTGGQGSAIYYIFYKVYSSDDAEWSEWIYYGEANGNSITIDRLQAGYLYRFSVNVVRTPDDSTYVEIDFQAVDFVDHLYAAGSLRCADTGTTTWEALDLDLIWDVVDIFTVDHYYVEILDYYQNVLRQSPNLSSPGFTYTFDMNVQDHGGTANPTVYVRVVAVDDLGNEQSTSITAFNNALPDAPTALIAKNGSDSIFYQRDLDVSWVPPADSDVELYEVTVTHGTNVVRTEFVTNPFFKYTYEMNNEDVGVTSTTTTTTSSTTATSNTQSSTTSTTTTSTTSTTTTSSTSSTTTTSSSTTTTTA